MRGEAKGCVFHVSKDLVVVRNNQAVTSSLLVAENFGREHKHVLDSIRSFQANLSTAEFSALFKEDTYKASNGKSNPMFYMNRDGFSLLVMGFTGKEALQWKLRYIERFNVMEKALQGQAQAKPITLEEQMAQGLIAANKLLEEKNRQIEEMKPKALFADAVSSSHSSILIRDLAQLIKQNGVDIGEKRLFKWLRENGYLIKGGSDKNMPTQKAMDMKLFEIKEGNYIDGHGANCITRTTKVTGKGQVYFVNKLLDKKDELAIELPF